MINQNFFEDINIIFDSTIEGIMFIKDGFIIDINKSFLEILKYDTKDDIIGNLATGCLMPYYKEKYIEYNHNKFQEISLVSKEGMIIPAIIKTKNINYKNEDIIMVSILDLTDLKNKEKLLLTQSKMAVMGETLNMIAHQWRQPLNAIAAAITNIKIKILKEENIKNIDSKINTINDYLQYMSNTIDDFKDFMKIKKKETSTLNNLIDQSLDLQKGNFEQNNIKVIIDKINLNNIYINKNEIIQVFLTILNNAIDAIISNKIKNPIIHISFKEEKTQQTVFIKDNAGGIKEEIIDKIFEPYFTTKDNFNGTGLGLYISKTIIENNNFGKISVENIEQGTCFKITLQKH